MNKLDIMNLEIIHYKTKSHAILYLQNDILFLNNHI